ncbi:MAG TPA: capsule assembly Wzi family protein [Gemmatimonadaceae bacterium]
MTRVTASRLHRFTTSPLYCVALSLVVALALSLVVALALPRTVHAQGTEWNEATVGSDWELYARALAARGMLSDEPWAIRPFSPAVLDKWSASLSAAHPWKDRLPQRTTAPKTFELLRPSVEISGNSAYAWGSNDGPVWQGKGVNAWATMGAVWRWGHISARFEPLVEYAQNEAFQLETVPKSAANPYVDAQTPTSIDLPQRMGSGAYHVIDPGNSYIRIDAKSVGAGFSTEDLFWGPGVRNALLFGPNAAGFPHLFFGTNQAVATPIGRFSGQVIYGRLQESDLAPPNHGSERLGAGLIVAWQLPSIPVTVGLDRFYHRAWPTHWSSADYTLPFGAFFSSQASSTTGTNADNQLASVFFSARAASIGFEVFGEFGKNDRNSSVRDLTVEPESNSAWLLGFLKVIGLDSTHADFWEVRGEVADARVPELQALGRGQSTFYDHSIITQGHTEAGQLLGTPLIERSGGAEFAVDHFTSRGRLGVTLTERQMPPDLGVGMPADSARSQWDLGVGGTIFHGSNDYTFQVGHVWDIDRFPGQDVGNIYLRLGMRVGRGH